MDSIENLIRLADSLASPSKVCSGRIAPRRQKSSLSSAEIFSIAALLASGSLVVGLLPGLPDTSGLSLRARAGNRRLRDFQFKANRIAKPRPAGAPASAPLARSLHLFDEQG
jgi:hypothetical protein